MYAIIHTIEPFDSTDGTTINFTWSGNQIFKVRCIIKENESGTTVYDKTLSSMKQSFAIANDSGLLNGKKYICYITVFDTNDVESSLQKIGTPFLCLSTPVFHLSINQEDVIRTSAYEVLLSYSQLENELLDYFNITLYTYQKVQLQTSSNVYKTSVLSYIISGLENATQYYIRCVGKTINGIHLDTGYIIFTVAYTQASIFSTLEVNNKPEIGAMELRSNVISTIGTSEKDVIYVKPHGVDLRDNAIVYESGYEIEGDFTHVFNFYKPNLNTPVIILNDANNKMTFKIIYREGTFEDSNGKKGVMELSSVSAVNGYVQYCNYFDIPSDTQQISYCITRKNNYFDTKTVLLQK